MSTRGEWGFIINGTRKVTYNHCDSHLLGLGRDFVTWLNDKTIGKMHTIASAIEMINARKETPIEVIGYVQRFEEKHDIEIINLHVDTCSLKNPYCVLRGTQNNFLIYDLGFKYMLEGSCSDYSYICNLDSDKFIFSEDGVIRLEIDLQFLLSGQIHDLFS